ncbi:hypothetical protein CHLRE_05g235850v5 [Chlamydomonas reinhardtii]|uniref:Uncharacterized protein n=1 Tax=Chlamydomonas reinhardtii TaxID=3055 RepID=A0A2K3DSR7_CHLRE|nr:uncharacterized protein CHLRE_05g235850v5 [Chlamydomonas reinhardtii]PNW83583.1 hypothetical protein CHLRE_05g235850v5 [Chlamydomonas reinhardtii]
MTSTVSKLVAVACIILTSGLASGMRPLAELSLSESEVARRLLEDEPQEQPQTRELLALIEAMSPSVVPGAYPSAYPSSSPPPPVYPPQSTPSPVPTTPTPSPVPTPTPSSPIPTPAPSPVPVIVTAPACGSAPCIKVNATTGTPFDVFLVSAPAWVSTTAALSKLAYEFGVVTNGTDGTLVYRIRHAFSSSSSAPIASLPVGSARLFACVRTVSAAGTTTGPRACETVTVSITAQVTALQVTQQMDAIMTAVTTSAAGNASTADLLTMSQKLAAVASVSDGGAVATASLKSVASSLMTRLFATASSAASSPPTAASIVSVFDAVGSLWGVSSDAGRAAVVGSISALSDQLAGESLEAADALPVIDLLTSMLEDQASLVATAAAANGGASQAAAKADAAKAVLASITHGTAALTRSLLNGAPADGTPAHIATAKLAAAVQRASAALAAAGITISVANPGSASSSGRRLLSSSSSAVGVALNPAVSQLCTADATCATAGFGVAVTVIPDSSLLLTSLGDNAAALAALLSDYRAGGSVQVISPIVRVAAPGLPASAYGGALASLVVLDLPINLTAVALDGATTRRALVRLQDVSAAAPDASAAISAAVSVTVTSNSGPATGAVDLISGFSNSLGDFAVLQYTSTATPTAGNTTTSPSPSGAPSSTASVSPSPLPSSLPPGGAGSMVAPSAAITSILLGLVVLLLLL